MELTPHNVRECLDQIDQLGWESPAGRDLLTEVRATVVLPVVRGTGLRGPAADQAAASGWEAAWDALRRPTARAAANPLGMVWVAVRRAVNAEVFPAREWRQAVAGAERPDVPWPRHHVSLDELLAAGWSPGPGRGDSELLRSTALDSIADALVDVGWPRATAEEALLLLADALAPHGEPAVRWRWVAGRVGVPAWQAKRLGALVLGANGRPGLLAIVREHGPGVLVDPAVHDAVRSTSRRWSAGPETLLATWDSATGTEFRVTTAAS